MSKTDSHYTPLANKPYPTPCGLCGATCRTDKGHDPCMPDLPGVLHACCGHGHRDAYVMFENCITIRGAIEFPKPQTIVTNQRFFLEDDTYTEGVMGDGAVILQDGVPLTISKVLELLNGRKPL